MPIRTYQETVCDLCGATKQRELFPKKEPSDGWLQLTVKNPKDLREKLKPVVCPTCVEAVKAAIVPEPEKPPTEADEEQP